jgi:ABC-type Fe3+-hydroxamate transport system substrate-binding protein
MFIYTDQLGRTIQLAAVPSRIISLVPSQTELLYTLGLDEQVIGITKFCVHPNVWFREKTRIGGTKTVKMDVIQQLQPDLIIANKEENVKEQVEELARHYPVWTSDINDLPDAFNMMEQIGIITSRYDKAMDLIRDIKTAFATLPVHQHTIPTAYLIWRNPYMTIGGDTFIHHMLARCGLQNVFGHTTRYPAITVEALQASGCRLLLLSSEPYPFKQQHISALQSFLPDTQIRLADGELFSWYGSRLLHAPAYFNALLRQVHAIS